MRKISSKGTNNILLKFTIKAVLSAIISIMVFTFIFSRISYSLDLDQRYNMIFTIFICAFCAAITGFFAVLGVKNNGIILGLIAQIPLIFYSFLNIIFNENTIVFFLIKLVIIVCTGMLFGYLAAKKSKKLRLK